MDADHMGPAEAAVSSVHTAPGYWGWGGVWSPLVTSDQTHGSYSILEQLMPANAGPPPHVHDHTEEVFYILEGEIRLQVRDQVVSGQAGQLVRIPMGTPHGFAVLSETARFLNLYVPGALDLMIAMLSAPAESFALPTADSQVPPPTDEQTQAFLNRVRDLASQSWSGQVDLLAQYRGDAHSGPGGPHTA